LADACDRVCACAAAFVPVGIVLGNVVFETALALVCLLYFFRLALLRENPLPFLKTQPVILAWFGWFAVAAVSVVANGAGSKGLGHDLVLVRFPLFLAAVVSLGQRRPLFSTLSRGLAAAVAAAAINTASAYLLGWDLVGHSLERYIYKLQEANRIASLMPYAAPFLMGWALGGKNLSQNKRIALLALCALAFGQALQTRIRTSILGAAAGLATVGSLLAWRRRKAPVAAAAVLLCVAAAGVLFFVGDNFRDLGSLRDRVYMWQVSVRIWQDNPLLGSGVSSFRNCYEAVAATARVKPLFGPGTYSQSAYHAHSLPVMLLAATGAAGLLAFALVYYLLAKRAFTTARGARAGLFSFPLVVASLGVTGFNPYSSCYQAILAFFTVLILLPEQDCAA